MSEFGIDYAWSRPTMVAMHNASVKFVCRYLSHDTTGKTLTRAEAETLTAGGLWLVVVWETTAARALAGTGAGQADAADALKQAQALGMPADRPIYFAVDFDAQPADQPKIDAYLSGASNVMGRDRMGMYSGVGPMTRCFDSGLITFGWQTYAWSGGKWDSRAQLQQYKNGVSLAGADVDFDRAMVLDYGQWKIGESPVALSADDKKYLTGTLVPLMVKAMWTTDGIVPAADDNPDNPHWTPGYHLSSMGKLVRALNTAVAALGVPDVDEAEIIAGVLAGLSPESLADMIATKLAPDVAGATLDALRARLED
jgi:hypothetical protein